MAGERIQSRRPFTSPILEMVIREHPEPPEAEPVLPRDIIVSSNTGEAIKDSARQAFRDVDKVDQEGDITVDRSVDFTKGLGQTTEYRILVNIKGASPEEVNEAVEKMVDQGYRFEFVKFN